LAQDLKALAAKLPKTPKVKLPNLPRLPGEGEGETMKGEGGNDLPPMPGPMPSREITEPEDDEGEDGDATLGDLTGSDSDKDPTEDTEKPIDAQAPGAPTPGMDDAPEPVSEDAGDTGKASDGATSDRGGRSDHEPEQPAEDLSDNTQVYEEAHLNDIAQEAARDADKGEYEVYQEAAHASTILNVRPLRDGELGKGADPKRVGAAIDSPAKLRRHLTIAVKSPERVANERRQVSGRLDMHNLVGLSIGAPNVFRRRVEEEGREAAVSLLLDVSGSMAGERIASARAMALHMGDALKAAGVRFEVAGFDDQQIVRPKAFSEGWAEPTRRRVAGLRTLSGTGMLPAMKASAERLLKVSNVTRRILLVLTDGQDSYAAEANAALCAFYQGRGVEIVGIGLQTHSVKIPFRGKCVEVWNTRSLSTDGLKALVKVLDAGAPRSA
jgi:cobaltochelatase CobT